MKDRESRFLDRLQQKNPTLYFIADLVINVVIIVALVYVVRTYLISPFQVFGPSMCDTLNNIKGRCQENFGEYLMVNKAVYYPFFGKRYGLPQRGDIVVFRPPSNPKDFYIKRIIGLPGETIKIKQGKVFLNEKELNELYLSKQNQGKTFALDPNSNADFTVPAGRYFVLGDNRGKSTDSRTCFTGPGDKNCDDPNEHFLDIGRIEGKAWVVLWPFTKTRLLRNPEY